MYTISFFIIPYTFTTESSVDMFETAASMRANNSTRNYLFDSLDAGKINIQRLVNANAAETSSKSVSGVIIRC